jgi:TetR/AcrR family acrAB operon transcriptional repressor
MVIKRKTRTQAERRDAAESKIILAAIELAASKGYDGFSLADVGTRAGFSRGLPAHYFGSKDRLLAAVADNIVTQYTQRAMDVLPHVEPGLPRLIEPVRIFAYKGVSRL